MHYLFYSPVMAGGAPVRLRPKGGSTLCRPAVARRAGRKHRFVLEVIEALRGLRRLLREYDDQAQYANHRWALPPGIRRTLELRMDALDQIESEWRGAGTHEVTVPVDRLQSGVYFARLTQGADVVTTRFVVTK